MKMGWLLEAMRVFWTRQRSWLCNLVKVTELYTVKWIIFYDMNFISLKKTFKIEVMNSENCTESRMMMDTVAGSKLLFLNQGLRAQRTLPQAGVQAQQTPSQPADSSLPSLDMERGGTMSQGTLSEAVSRAENHLLASNVLIIQLMDDTRLVCTEFETEFISKSTGLPCRMNQGIVCYCNQLMSTHSERQINGLINFHGKLYVHFR